jgi:hypothetical protein
MKIDSNKVKSITLAGMKAVEMNSCICTHRILIVHIPGVCMLFTFEIGVLVISHMTMAFSSYHHNICMYFLTSVIPMTSHSHPFPLPLHHLFNTSPPTPTPSTSQ